ncbi:Mov34/MPN/PAD-1 family protein [Flavihumibacter sp. ZG627]|uniref:Mov34/MPN/PAD-1 family protein n=1 Tax=Flavihumibacter sp. ZG627 TaxID=1463156 RepID=UPI00057CF314|nr:Mov34/MPN/PAD-1 family protein [Flavihumibacter sp. ZG627]KIC89905.1 hypothetical protein HY58_14730 [Flavihumibacter sp. ZG627]
MPATNLSITKPLWKKLIKELKKRGKGIRESGAFLLGNSLKKEVTEFICYDELDPNSLDTGIIVFDGDGYIPLWKICREKGLQVLADVHTHPGNWTGQSGPDKKHPMIAQAGHLALIVPHLATKRGQLLNNIGIHEYLGDKQWRTWETVSGKFIITDK